LPLREESWAELLGFGCQSSALVVAEPMPFILPQLLRSATSLTISENSIGFCCTPAQTCFRINLAFELRYRCEDVEQPPG
jgi:hypothetical protein